MIRNHTSNPSFHRAPTPREILGLVAWAVFLLCAYLGSLTSRGLAQDQNLPGSANRADVIRKRQDWFYNQRAYPLKHIPPGARLKALEQLRQMERSPVRRAEERNAATQASTVSTNSVALSSTQWTLIGPQPTRTPFAFNPVSGRVTALAVDPTNPNVVYLGAAEGGVWKTTDGGTTWTPLTDKQPSLAVGSIAIDPSNHNTIYVGTGEEDFAPDLPRGGNEYYGAGVLKSTDGGSTWTQLAGPFVGPFYSLSPQDGGAFIGSIAVSPSNPQELLAAVRINNGGSSQYSGIYMSLNGGSSWTEVETSTLGPPTQVFFDPTNPSVAYASFLRLESPSPQTAG